MMSLTFGLFTPVSGSGPLGPLVVGRCELHFMVQLIWNTVLWICIIHGLMHQGTFD